MVAHLLRAQLGCSRHRGHSAAALRVSIMIRCSKRRVAGNSVGADTAIANLQRQQRLSTGGRRRKSSASVSRPVGMLAAYGTLSRSLVVHHHDLMQANAVSQRAAWVLVPRPLNIRVSDAVSAHFAPRPGGAPVLGTTGVLAASGTPSSSFARYSRCSKRCVAGNSVSVDAAVAVCSV